MVGVATQQQGFTGRSGSAPERQQGSASAGELSSTSRSFHRREVDVHRNGGIHRRNDLAFAGKAK